MPKTINLPELPITDGMIRLNTGEMTAVALGAIRKEAEERKRMSVIMHSRVIEQARTFARSHTIARIRARSALWEAYFNDLAPSS